MRHLSRPDNCQLLTVNCRRWRHGFALIEICLSMLFILALVVILLTASGTYITSRKSNLQTSAIKIASRETETLRNTEFTSLPVTGPISDPDLSKLPSGNASRTISDYDVDGKIKLVTIQVNWIENSVSREIKIDTLISENGL